LYEKLDTTHNDLQKKILDEKKLSDEIEDGTFCLPKLFKLGLFLISRWTFPLSFAQPRVLLLFSIL